MAQTEAVRAIAWHILEQLVGSVHGATDQVVTIYQDDATYNYHVEVGKGRNAAHGFGRTLALAVHAANAARKL